MNLADQPFADRSAGIKIIGDQVESIPIVEQLAHVVHICLGDALPGKDLGRLGQRQPGALDVGRWWASNSKARALIWRTELFESCAASRKPLARSMRESPWAMVWVMVK